ncbi:MAG: nucleotidyltransferase domain-containing protein [Candidatus Micrarchaeia archaeon]
MEDQERVERFLEYFKSQLVKACPRKIDFILVFGSVARGEFKAGVSDIDMIIQCKREEFVELVERNATRIFWEADKKFETKFCEVCSTARGRRESEIKGIEKELRLYKPFEVVGPNDIDWRKGSINHPGLAWWSFFIPKYLMARKIKYEGKVIYGRDIRKEIEVRNDFLDRVKGLFIPQILSLLSLPLLLISFDKAIKYSTKAAFYSVENQLYFLEAEFGSTDANVKKLRKKLGDVFSVRFMDEARRVKYDFEDVRRDWTKLDKVLYCIDAIIFVFYLNWAVFIKYIIMRFLHLW